MLTRIVAIRCWGLWFSPAKIIGMSLAIHNARAPVEIELAGGDTSTTLPVVSVPDPGASLFAAAVRRGVLADAAAVEEVSLVGAGSGAEWLAGTKAGLGWLGCRGALFSLPEGRLALFLGSLWRLLVTSA